MQTLMKLKRELLIMIIIISILLLQILTAENFAERLKQANLASKSDITNFGSKTDFDNKLSGFNERINSNKTKEVLFENRLNKLSNNVKAMSTKEYGFFFGRIYLEYTSADGLKNMFIYQPTLSMIKYHHTRNKYIISQRSKGVYITKFIPIKNYSLSNRKYFCEKIALQFNYTPLVVEQNNYPTKTVNIYILYDFVSWQKNPLRNSTLKKCFFFVAGKGKLSFGNDLA